MMRHLTEEQYMAATDYRCIGIMREILHHLSPLCATENEMGEVALRLGVIEARLEKKLGTLDDSPSERARLEWPK
jgi:hypothetical protein